MMADVAARNSDRGDAPIVVVSDHDNPSRQYAFDDATGAWRTRRLWPWANKIRGISGYGAVLSAAVTVYPDRATPRAKTLLALYAVRDALRFRVGRHSWDVTASAIDARITKADSTSAFELAEAGTPIVRIEYEFYWSSEDFFTYVAETLANDQSRDDTVRRWTSHP
jgi:hypothetical protein